MIKTAAEGHGFQGWQCEHCIGACDFCARDQSQSSANRTHSKVFCRNQGFLSSARISGIGVTSAEADPDPFVRLVWKRAVQGGRSLPERDFHADTGVPLWSSGPSWRRFHGFLFDLSVILPYEAWSMAKT